MQVETGMAVASAFLLVGGASLAFVVGGAMVFSTLLLSLAQPLPLVVIFSASSFVFVAVALMEMLHYTQQSFTKVLLLPDSLSSSSSSSSSSVAAGLGQLFAIMSMVVGIVLLYTVDAVIYRISMLAAGCYGESARTQRQRVVMARGSFSQLDLAASGCSHDLYTAGASSTANHAIDPFHGPTIPEISTSMSSYEPFSTQSVSQRVRGTLLSVLAVVLHHTPEGLALYVAAMRHLHLGVAVAVAVALHNLPDGIALASSIYFASGHRLRGVLWCVLSPVGKLLGATVAWLLMGMSHSLPRVILTGVATGVLLGIGVKEVMPTTHNYAVGKAHGTVIGIVTGMAVVASSRLIT